MGRFGRILKTGGLVAGVLLWMLFVNLVGEGLHSPIRSAIARIQAAKPSLHADEAVQWSLAKDSSAGVAYSENQDKFHGPALALATRGVFAVRGLNIDDASESDLRLVPFLFYLLICAAPFVLRGVSLLTKTAVAVLLLLSSAGCYFGHYFIQETLLVAGFVWGALLWMESADAPAPWWQLALAGAGFGLALACKVTAAAYLVLFLLTLLFLARETLTKRRIAWAAVSATLVWVGLQTCVFTDLNGLAAWGHQFGRSFGVASGNDDTLPLTNPGYWWAIGLWLAFLVAVRFYDPRPRSARDVPLALAVSCFLFHLALPYKTPWLLFLPVCVTLSWVLPLLAEGTPGRLVVALSFATLFVWTSLIVLERHTHTRFNGRSLAEKVGEYRKAWQQANPGKRFYVAVSGGHYWPLPYYLRAHPVGYGDFKGAEDAPLRFLPAHDDSQPFVHGRQTYSLQVRSGERFWVLVWGNEGDGPAFSSWPP